MDLKIEPMIEDKVEVPNPNKIVLLPWNEPELGTVDVFASDNPFYPACIGISLFLYLCVTFHSIPLLTSLPQFLIWFLSFKPTCFFLFEAT